MLEVELKGARLELLPERALWWPERGILILTDLHWGKGAHFRKHGIPIPAASQLGDQQRLSGLIERLRPAQLIIAGDMFHSAHNQEVEAFGTWRSAYSQLDIVLVRGNHDILPESFYTSCRLALQPEMLLAGPLAISHDALEVPGYFNIHGHVHPGIHLHGRGRQRMSLCCFCASEERMILPAFGSFTGNYYINPVDFKQICVIAGTEVLRWK